MDHHRVLFCLSGPTRAVHHQSCVLTIDRSLSPAAVSEAEAFFSARKDTSCSQKAQYHREDGELGWDGSGGRES